ncbi:MAG: COG4315 family predicted lipoprotein [Acidimicrobiales bacterium]
MLALAGCGSTTKASTSSTTAAAPASSGGSGGGVTIEAHSVGQLGTVLVDQNGKTLYLLTSETGGKMTCTDANGCTTHWPPVVLPSGTSSATAGMGADASKLGTEKSASGDTLVTYNGWPLYTFSGDSAAGTSNGEGLSSFGGTWEAVMTDGMGVTTGSGASGGTSTTLYHY